MSFLTSVMCGLSRIVRHYTADPVVVGGLSSALLVDLVVYQLGLLTLSAARLTALNAAEYMLDESLLLFSAETVSWIFCAVSADDQAAVYARLIPLLRDGSTELVLEEFTSAAARLMNGDAQSLAVLTRGSVASRHSIPVSWLSVNPAPSAALRQLLCVACPALSCYRPTSVAASHVEQSWLVQNIVAALSTPSPVVPWSDPSRSAVIHLAACIVNKLPADSPLLTSMTQSLLEQYALDTLERMVQPNSGVERWQGGESDVVRRVAVAACLLKALALRSHSATTALLIRYAQLPSHVSDEAAGGGTADVLRRWSDGFALLISDFPLLLTRSSHARTVGPATLFRQRLLNTLLPVLQRQIEQRQEQRRQRAKQRSQHQPTPLLNDSSSAVPVCSAADTEVVGGDVEACLSCLLLATMQLAVHVPYHVAAQCMAQLLPLTVLSLAGPSSDCRIAGLRTLHSFLDQQQRLSTHTSPLSQLAAHLPSIVPVLLSILTRQLHDVPSVDDELRALDCLSALHFLPFSALYPFRGRVLSALAECADREERAIRRHAIRVRNEWSAND